MHPRWPNDYSVCKRLMNCRELSSLRQCETYWPLGNRSSASPLPVLHFSPFRELHGVPEIKSPRTISEPSLWQSSLNRRAASQAGAAVHRSTSPNASAEARTSAVASTSGRNADTKPEAKVRGPKHQSATPPQPRRLITTPISPNLIVEPYRYGMPSDGPALIAVVHR